MPQIHIYVDENNMKRIVEETCIKNGCEHLADWYAERIASGDQHEFLLHTGAKIYKAERKYMVGGYSCDGRDVKPFMHMEIKKGEKRNDAPSAS